METKLLYNCKKAAEYLGLPIASFYRLKKKHEIFQPIMTEFSYGPRYHIEHLKIISSVIIGTLEPNEALEIWEAKKTVIGFKGI